ncbi:PREDICTED: vanin-like protein 3 isoform X2 [Papilio xuthus]|uniref:Vanin-like protein 3 isoform X2 n=1 Tax=Papilio xuthus TaxID=66420 RepID=A0AAJ7E7K5_PAPXU|nr:PREDICTED: vanin-like protein 3 isoform X2 [Papilio xuthus]
MEVLLKFILLFLCYHSAVCSEVTYKATVISGNLRNGLRDYLPQMNEISKQNVDIVLLASEVSDSETYGKADCTDNYDELIRDISLLANRFNIYVVTHLYQKVQCQGNVEAMKNNIVFDRKGAIVAVYTKPLNNYATCNVTSQNTFTTDFGVEFLVLMEEDLLLQDLESLRNTKNVIITGRAADNMVYIKGNQLIASLAYISDVNVLSDDGIFIGKAGLKSKGGVLEINKNGKDKHITLSFNPIDIRDIPLEDTNQYIIRPLDLEASLSGYQETVCDGGFCCQFYVKTRSLCAKTTEAHYGLSVYSGVRRTGEHYIGVDSCKLVVCAALYKRTCVLGLESNMDVVFEKISIKGNFTAHHSTQFPVILTTQTSMSSDSFSFVKKLTKDIQEVSAELSNAKNILKFGILSRDFTRDYDDANFNSNSSGKIQYSNDFYEYILNEDIFEFFDYLWIKIRVLIFIVSIYILEMM